MPFNISNFNSNIAKSGIASPSFFEAQILRAPSALAPMMSEGMSYRIESVNLPGRTLTTLDQNYHGPVRRIPFRFTHQPVTFSIILSRDMREREAFMKWQDFFVGHHRTTLGALPSHPFDTHYYDDGIGEIQIIQYSYPISTTRNNIMSDAANARLRRPMSDAAVAGQPDAEEKPEDQYDASYVITLYEAYPSSVNDIQMAWSDDGYAKLQVEIQYRYSSELQRTFADAYESEMIKEVDIVLVYHEPTPNQWFLINTE
jgi:hypothetical protein